MARIKKICLFFLFMLFASPCAFAQWHCVFHFPEQFCSWKTPSPVIIGSGFVSGGIYTSDTGLIINSTTGTIDGPNSPIGIHNVTYTVSVNETIVFSGSHTVTVEVLETYYPPLEFTYPTPVCQSMGTVAPTIPAGSTQDGIFSVIWSWTSISIDPDTGVIDLEATLPGTYTINYYMVTDDSYCNRGGIYTFDVVVLPATLVTDFTYPTVNCSEGLSISPVTPTDFTSGGFFSSDAGLSIDSATGEVDIQDSTLGAHTITYTISSSLECDNGGNSSFIISIDNAVSANTGFSYASPVCGSSTSMPPVLPVGFSSGGSFTSDAGLVLNSSTGEIDPAASTAGAHEVLYTVTSDSVTCITGATSAFSIFIAEQITPVTHFTYPANICKLQNTVAPLLMPGFTFGGLFTSDGGLVINPLTGEIDSALSVPGSHTINYLIDANPSACSDSGSDNFTIVIEAAANPYITFSYTSPMCTNSMAGVPMTVTGFTMGGVFSSDSGLSINSDTGIIDIGQSTIGLHTITYTLADDNMTCVIGGYYSATISIEITPALPAISGPSQICVGDVTQFTHGIPNGDWNSSDESIASIAPDGTMIANSSGTVIIKYILDDACLSSTSKTVVVNALPIPILENKNLCLDDDGQVSSSVVLDSGLIEANYSFAWTLNGSPLANSTSTHIASQTGVYEIIATDLLTGCSSNAIATVSAYGMIAGEAIVSEEFDSEQNITITVSGGSGEYLYQLNNGAIQQSNIFYNVPIGEHTIMVLDPFGCEPLLLKVYILKYPLFFTPNADGYNDYWNIITPSELQEVSIIIYDRYGKIIKNIRSNGAGWDGTLHGNRMPATDYWFTMRYRKDQIYREIKSHFSLKR